METRKLIIDTDPGIDDAAAIAIGISRAEEGTSSGRECGDERIPHVDGIGRENDNSDTRAADEYRTAHLDIS